MITYTLVLYSCFLIYLALGIYVYHLNRQSLVNQSFLILCGNLSLWAIGYALVNSAESHSVAFICLIVSSLGWCFFYSSFLYFALMLTGKEGICRQSWFRAALYIPSLLFFVHNLSYPQNQFQITSYGLVYNWSSTVFREISFSLYYISFLTAALIIIYLWGKKAAHIQEKKQAHLIVFTTIISLLLGAFTDTLLPKWGISVPPMAIVYLIIGITGTWYAITKYRMMTLTPEVAVDYVLKTMLDPVFFIGPDFLIKRINQAASLSTGFAAEELIGQPFHQIFADVQDPQEFKQLISNDLLQKQEKIVAVKNQFQIPFLLATSVVYGNWGELLGTVCILHNIDELKKAETALQKARLELEHKVVERTAELEKANHTLQKEIAAKELAQQRVNHIAYHDALTGLPNRRLLREQFDQAILHAQKNNTGMAVVFLDLDNFKLLNDSLGHPVGDELLQQVAQRLGKCTRSSDTIARISGDEFIFIVANLNNTEDLKTVLDKIMAAFIVPFPLDIHEIFVTASMGAAIYPRDGKDYDTLAKNADIAMYAAKASGRNNYQLCTLEMKSRFIARSKLRNNLYRALERNELSVFYQPQIDIKAGQIIGFEALMRWRPSHEDFISPAEFISIAEETGLIVDMGEWIIRMACRQIKKWHMDGYPHLKMAINLSAQQLKQKSFPGLVSSILQEHDLAPALLEFEITERIVFTGNEDLITVLHELKSIGVRISIDDFGVEHSSFMNIKKIPIDKIKIDMQFIQGITVNKKDAAIVDAIIELAHKVGLKVLAEGVESSDQLTYISERSCDEVQGFFYYKPLPADEIELILEQREPKLL